MAAGDDKTATEQNEEGHENDSKQTYDTTQTLEKQIEESRKQLEQLILDGETMVSTFLSYNKIINACIKSSYNVCEPWFYAIDHKCKSSSRIPGKSTT